MDYKKSWKNGKLKIVLLHTCAFLFCVLFAFVFRNHIRSSEISTVKKAVGADFAPFEVESAIMFSYINNVADGKGIPEYDPRLKLTHGYRVSEQMSLGLEYFLGWGLRLRRQFIPPKQPPQNDYETDPDESSWITAQLCMWACLVPGFIYLWLIFLNQPWYIAILGGVLSGIAPASVARHTGQLLLKGTFALPFLAATLAFFSFAFKRKGIMPLLLVMFCAFCSVVFWDASQLVLGVWAGFEILRWIIYGSDERRRQVFTVVYAVMVIAALITPYNRAHYALFSPALIIIWPTLTGLHYTGIDCFKKRFATALAFFVLLSVVHTGILHNSQFAKNYSHFSSLAKAKIIYLNIKPSDPAKLSFEQRFLWTPGLHSATWNMTKNLFPYAFWSFLVMLFAGLAIKKVRIEILKNSKESLAPFGAALAFFVFYIFFVRFHVFSALALNAAFPLIVYNWQNAFNKRWCKVLIVLLASIVVTLEGMHTLKLKRNYDDQFFKETGELVKWFRKSGVEDKVVLTDMEISPVLKAYCGTAILVQPKFELAEIRENVKKYVDLIYHGSELEVASYCAENKVDFLVYVRGKTAPMHIHSYRYMADAKRIKTKSIAYRMERYPRSMRFFYEIVPPKEFSDINKRYRIYKVIYPQNIETASYAADLALEYYYTGRKKLAYKLAESAFLTNPKSKKTYLTYYKITGKIPRPGLADFSKISN
jgi:hypothetical protein